MRRIEILAALTAICLCATDVVAQKNASGPRSRMQTGVLPGIALPERNVNLSTPIEGVIAEILVAEGEQVEVGQALARLDDRVARAAVAAAELAASSDAEIQHAQAELQLARQKVARMERAGDAINEMQMAEARIRLAQAESSLASAQQSKRQAELNLALERARLDRMTIRAPFAGRISKLIATTGETITTHDDMLQLVSLETFVTDVYAPLGLYGRLEVGATYLLEAGAPIGRKVEAELVYIDPVLDAASQRFRCRFRIQNPEQKMPAGFTVRMTPDPKPMPRAKPQPAKGR